MKYSIFTHSHKRSTWEKFLNFCDWVKSEYLNFFHSDLTSCHNSYIWNYIWHYIWNSILITMLLVLFVSMNHKKLSSWGKMSFRAQKCIKNQYFRNFKPGLIFTWRTEKTKQIFNFQYFQNFKLCLLSLTHIHK